MGVHGLWPLLHPVARPVALETMGGKKLAIDSSIWLYQFQIAMRDKEGRALDNAHILGFLRRICKLLFYGIKPVFVFDGGAPIIKKIAISNRKNKKQGAKESAARTAEKLLAAQLRAAAVAQAQKTALENETGEIVDAGNANYMDDDYGIAPRGAPQRTRKRSPVRAVSTEQIADGTAPPLKKKKYVHRDQYALPVVDGPIGANAKPSDPRLATEAELRSFIDDMRPEDFDMDSEFFSELPIEVKYEIIGDLRIKSRQANYRRVEAMRNAPTPLDFSRAQILGLSNRNVLTQKLLTVTDSLSRIQPLAGQSMRIAGERNKEYVLVKNDSQHGTGYMLGIREDGRTASKPVKIEATTTEESDNGEGGGNHTTTDEEFEAVDIPSSSSSPAKGHHRYSHSPDPELRRELALEAIKQRYSPVKPKTKRGDSPIDDLPILPPQKPLFGKVPAAEPIAAPVTKAGPSNFPWDNSSAPPRPNASGDLADFQPDFDLWDALQQSIQTAENDQHYADEQDDLQRAIERSRAEEQVNGINCGSRVDSGNGQPVDDGDESDVSFDEVEPAGKMDSPAKNARKTQNTAPEETNGYASDGSVEYVKVSSPIYPPTQPKASAQARAPSQEIVIPSTRSIKPLPTSVPKRKATPVNISLTAGAQASEPINLSSEEEHPISRQKPSASLHIDIPSAAYRPPSPEQEQHQNGRTPRPDLTDKQIERDTSPTATREHEGVVERDYAQHPPSEPQKAKSTTPQKEPLSESLVVRQNGKAKSKSPLPPLAVQPALPTRPTLMERTLSEHSERSPSPAELFDEVQIPTTSAPDTQISKSDEKALQNGTMSVLQEGRASTDAQDQDEELDKGDLQEEVQSGDIGSLVKSAPGNEADGAQVGSPEVFFEWSASPEPVTRKRSHDPTLLPPDDPNYIPAELLDIQAGHELSETENDEDAEQVASLTSEQKEYAKFLSELKNKNLDEMEYEVQNELRVLNEQNKRDRKLADDITQQMAKDIQLMLKVLGLPYVVAPMEAEAQCAELLSRNLVDGVITDDNDVFLFGATRVYKNMFNQNKYVECYLASDIDRELALDREKLIRLAHFLGSDYCDGLPGVGPVLGMELMAEFPGANGLAEFRNWWLKVQRGRDTPADHPTAFRRKFKKSKRELYVDEAWPNPEVAKAYLRPEVDESNEGFAWGIPDLDALRDYLKDNLGWGPAKVDELMMPIIKKMTGRAAGSAVNQATISNFFDVSGGTGRYAPMANKGYSSKRLQNVVKAWRQSQQKLAKEEGDEDEEDEDSQNGKKDESGDSGDVASKPPKKKARPAAGRRRSSTKASSSSRQTSQRPSQRGDSEEDSDAGFNAELEAKLAKMGVKRKREAPIGSDRIIRPAQRSRKDGGKGKAKSKGKGKGKQKEALFAPDTEGEQEPEQPVTKVKKPRKKAKKTIVAEEEDDNEDDADYRE